MRKLLLISSLAALLWACATDEVQYRKITLVGCNLDFVNADSIWMVEPVLPDVWQHRTGVPLQVDRFGCFEKVIRRPNSEFYVRKNVKLRFVAGSIMLDRYDAEYLMAKDSSGEAIAFFRRWSNVKRDSVLK